VNAAGGATDYDTERKLALRVDGVSKSFGGQLALSDVSFDLRPGEVHSLVGENGSGKSTLVKLLAGYHQPDKPADLWVRGNAIRLGDAAATKQAGLRFVHQDLGLIPSLSTVDNMGIAAGFETKRGGISWRRSRERARRALQALDFEIDVDCPVGQLTPTERAGIAIARALEAQSGEVTVLVLDEPTAALSELEARRLFDAIFQVRERGVGVIFVSHYIDEVLDVSDRVTVLRDGRLVGTFAREALDHDHLVSLIIGRELTRTVNSDVKQTNLDVPALSATNLKGGSLRDLSFAVYAGQALGVAGLSGSGREDICSLVFGHLARTGTVSISGKELPPGQPTRSVMNRVAYVSGDREACIFANFNVRENLNIVSTTSLTRFNMFMRNRERNEAERWIDAFHIQPPEPERAILELSGGNQQKVLIARAFRAEPKVLLLDDPTRGVDIGSKEEIHKLISRACEAGMAVLISSTDHDELVRVANRILILKRGASETVVESSEVDAEAVGDMIL
jgi:ribose transport system ATP-binding protein